MPNRFYSNTARPTTLENPGGVTPTTTSLILADRTGYPTQFPFVLRLEPDTPNEELVLVNSGVGNAASPYQVFRGIAGTTAKSHAQFSIVAHSMIAEDLAEPQYHMSDTQAHVQPILYTNQVTEPPYNITLQFVNFTQSEWPRIVTTAPPSGKIKITVGASVLNAFSTTATAWANWRITGSITLEGRDWHGVSGSGGRTLASRTTVVEVPPNGSLTITPTWYISAGNASTCTINHGQLIVERVI